MQHVNRGPTDAECRCGLGSSKDKVTAVNQVLS
jgi:hypothetical protein